MTRETLQENTIANPTAETAFASPMSRWLQRGGLLLLRYGLVFILLLGGASKWTADEAKGIQPWMEHSPFLFWLYRVTSVQGASIVIGVIEIAAALFLLTRRFLPRLAAVGSAMIVLMTLTTLSFLITTPHQGPDAQGFLIKDIFLLGAAAWSLGDSLTGVQRW